VRKFRREIIERGAHVVLFAYAAIVDSLAQSRPAEIEAQYRDAAQVQRFRRLVHNFVVHAAAEKWMRVTHHGDERWIGMGHCPEQSFEAPGGACEEKITMECFSHEIVSARV